MRSRRARLLGEFASVVIAVGLTVAVHADSASRPALGPASAAATASAPSENAGRRPSALAKRLFGQRTRPAGADEARDGQDSAAGLVTEVHSERFGYSFDLQGLQWSLARGADLMQPSAETALRHGIAAYLTVRAFPLLGHDPDIELVCKAILNESNIAYPSTDLVSRGSSSRDGVETRRFAYSYQANGSECRSAILIAKASGRIACMVIAGSSAQDAQTLAMVEESVGRFRLNPRSPDPNIEDFDAAHREECGRFLDRIGLAALERGRPEAAVRYLKTAATLSPGDVNVLRDCILALKQRQQLDDARQMLDECLPKFSDNVELLTLKADVLSRLGEVEGAIGTLRDLVEKSVRNDSVLQEYARLLDQVGKRDDAIKALARYLEQGRSLPVAVALAGLYGKEGWHDKAIALLRGFTERLPHDEQAAWALAGAYLSAKRYTETINECDRLVGQGQESSHAWYLKGLAQSCLKQFGESKASLEKAISLDAADPDPRTLLDLVQGALGQGSNHLIAKDIEPVSAAPWLKDRLAERPAVSPDATDACYIHRVRLLLYRKGLEYRETEHQLVRILTSDGAAQFKSFELPFDPLRERICVNELTVRDEAGHAVSSGEFDSYFVQDDTSGPYPNHKKTLTIPVKGLAPGRTVELVVTRKSLSAPDRMRYSSVSFRSSVPVQQWIVCVQGDVDDVAAHSANGATMKRIDGSLCWEVRNPPTNADWEPLQPPYHELLPGIRLGGVGSWDSVAAEFQRRWADRVTLDDETRQAAATVVGDTPDTEARILKLAEFVQKEFAYQAIEFGVRGRVPNPAARTLESRCGDCKDLSLLLVQLLKAVGVEAYVALVATHGSLAKEVAEDEQFDHAIVHVPGFRAGWFFDCTDKHYFPGGSPPPALIGKEALIMDAEHPRFATIADAGLGRDEIRVKRHLVYAERGMELEETATMGGVCKLHYDAMLLDWPEKEPLNMLRSFLSTEERGVTLTAHRVDRPSAAGKPLVICVQGRVRRAFHRIGNDEIGDLPALWEGRFVQPQQVDKRKMPFRIERPQSFMSETVLEVPAGYRLGEQKEWEPQNERSPFGRWECRLEREGPRSVRILFECEEPAGQYPADEYQRFAAWRDRGMESLQRTIVIQREAAGSPSTTQAAQATEPVAK